MKLEIKNLNKKDIPACLRIIAKTEVSSNIKEAKRIMEYSLARGIKPLNPNYYVLKLNDEIIGVSGLYYDYEDPTDIMWMDYFAVLPKYQEQGYGIKMFKNLKKICKNKNVRILCVFTDNKKKLNFYRKNGFKVCGEIKNYYSRGVDRIWLYKTLK